MSLDISFMEDGRQVYDFNITHNVTQMADAAGIYLPMWQGIIVDEKTDERAYRLAFDEGDMQWVAALNLAAKRDGREVQVAADMIPALSLGIRLLALHPARFKPLEGENGWGTWRNFLPAIIELREVCVQHPQARVEISR